VTILSVGGNEYMTSSKMPFVSILRILRVFKLLRLIPRADGLRTMFQTLAFSFPALFNVGGVLFLFFYIYAVIGVQLFGNVKRGENLDRHANFETFGGALLTLFRMSTGESWNGIMHDALISKDCLFLKNTHIVDSAIFEAGRPIPILVLGVNDYRDVFIARTRGPGIYLAGGYRRSVQSK